MVSGGFPLLFVMFRETMTSRYFTLLHMPQEKISQNFTRRLHVLKAATEERWDEIASALGVTREHLYNYRAGKYQPTEHVLIRLEAAERAAGIGTEPEPSTVAIKRFVEINDRRHSGLEISEQEKAETDRLAPEVLSKLQSLTQQVASLERAIQRIEKKLDAK
jgi:transcriptional regulator with XRE-family HTH domain